LPTSAWPISPQPNEQKHDRQNKNLKKLSHKNADVSVATLLYF